jgi:hypothetical protein
LSKTAFFDQADLDSIPWFPELLKPGKPPALPGDIYYAMFCKEGIQTSTLQRHLTRGEQPDTGEKRLYVLDDSSLAFTRQMHEFVRAFM